MRRSRFPFGAVRAVATVTVGETGDTMSGQGGPEMAAMEDTVGPGPARTGPSAGSRLGLAVRVGLLIASLAVLLAWVGRPRSSAGSEPEDGLEHLIRSSVFLLAGSDCRYPVVEAPEGAPAEVPSYAAMFSTCGGGWTGSGTIVDDAGTILTNAHVALEGDGVAARPAWVLVYLTVDARQAPRPAFYARAQVFDPALDLALLRPEYDLDGRAVDLAAHDLRPLPIAESEVAFGEEIRNIGYPGIGGDLITLTSGRVAGFEADPANASLGSDGWVKTDATLGGGVSGGTSINAKGELVGIPTEIGGVESRPLGEAGVDVAVGQINHLRPAAAGLRELYGRAVASGQIAHEDVPARWRSDTPVLPATPSSQDEVSPTATVAEGGETMPVSEVGGDAGTRVFPRRVSGVVPAATVAALGSDPAYRISGEVGGPGAPGVHGRLSDPFAHAPPDLSAA